MYVVANVARSDRALPQKSRDGAQSFRNTTGSAFDLDRCLLISISTETLSRKARKATHRKAMVKQPCVSSVT